MKFRYDREPVRALQGLAPGHVVQLGTISKTLAPALRLGWVVAPAALADLFASTKRLLDDFSPALDQLTLAEFLTRGHYDRHLRRARAVYRSRRDRVLAAIAEHLPELAVEGIAAGVHLLLRLPPELDDHDVASRAKRAGIAVPPLSAFRLTPSETGGLVLGYGRLHESAVDGAIRALDAVVFLAVKRLVYQDPGQLPRFTPESIELRHEILVFGLVFVPPHEPTGEHDRHVIPLRHGPRSGRFALTRP
jgi:GntR family transcriptional regulator/MocR family aminotransferase